MKGIDIKPYTYFASPPVTDNGEAVPTPKEMVGKIRDNIRLYHTDHLGSTALVTDLDGEVTQNVAYIPYGEVSMRRNSMRRRDSIITGRGIWIRQEQDG